jgi:hypothetical protein
LVYEDSRLRGKSISNSFQDALDAYDLYEEMETEEISLDD